MLKFQRNIYKRVIAMALCLALMFGNVYVAVSAVDEPSASDKPTISEKLFAGDVSSTVPTGEAINVAMGSVQQISPFDTQMVVPPFAPVEQVTDWSELQAAVSAAAGASVDIHVMNDITADFGAVTIPLNATVYLRSNPASSNIYSIFQDNWSERHFVVDGGNLSMVNIQLTRIAPAGIWFESGGITVQNSGNLEMFAGSVISGNEAEFGGGIYVGNGTLDMQGGIISGNRAFSHDGGGVHVNAGIFIMGDGEISGNTSFEMGGGVGVTESGTFIMQGGAISGNKAETMSGGGVAVSNSSFTMSGGTINDNTALSVHGGGIYITNDGSFTMTGGTIINNTALWMHGGGIYNSWGSSVTISGGAIVNNTAPHGSGGGIFTILYDSLTIGPDTIFIGNTASSSHDWFLSPSFLIDSINVPAGESGWGQGGSIANIGWYSTSIAGAHLLNNYDINFNGAPIAYQVVTFRTAAVLPIQPYRKYRRMVNRSGVGFHKWQIPELRHRPPLTHWRMTQWVI